MADFPRVPFTESIEALQRRGLDLFPSGHWATVWQNQHHAGFTVARSAGFDILKDIHTALLQAKAQGLTFNDFRRDLIPALQRKGWWGRRDITDPLTGEARSVQLGSVRRLRTIFDVNMRVSAAQGRWEQQQQLKDTNPYLRYIGILDSRIRPQHRRWHNTVLPIDHPWWKTHYPPNGWKCRCRTMAVTREDAEQNGWKIGAPPDEGTRFWTNPATGEIIEVPVGIDPGWAYNPGDVSRAAQAAKLAMDKLVMLPPALGAEAVVGMAFAFPEVEREMAAWLESIAVGLATDERWHAKGERRVVGCIDNEVLAWLAAHAGITPESAAITLEDKVIMHMVRTAKQERGNAIPLEELVRLPSLIMKPDAVYWDKGPTRGDQKRDPGLIYVWQTDERGAGKIIVRVNLPGKMRDASGKKVGIVTNMIRSGRVDIVPVRDLSESDGYIKIRGNL